MQRFLKIIAHWIYHYGKVNAGMASIRGSYEEPVPTTLQNK